MGILETAVAIALGIVLAALVLLALPALAAVGAMLALLLLGLSAVLAAALALLALVGWLGVEQAKLVFFVAVCVGGTGALLRDLARGELQLPSPSALWGRLTRTRRSRVFLAYYTFSLFLVVGLAAVGSLSEEQVFVAILCAPLLPATVIVIQDWRSGLWRRPQ